MDKPRGTGRRRPRWAMCACVGGSLSEALLTAAAQYSTAMKHPAVTRIGIGSCNKQTNDQPMWDSIASQDPELWLWMGDAVYVKGDGGIDEMRRAYAKQRANVNYTQFLANGRMVEGVWDDHDYGVNDAGKELEQKPQRVKEFLDFLGLPEDDPRRGRKSLYSSHIYGEAPKQVKVIMLDTRSKRDAFYLPNFSSKAEVKGWEHAAGAVARWFASFFCLGGQYEADMLGEDQWAWLEGELAGSQAAVTLIVSTVQVLTANPIMESWGHFPESRKRLLRLLDQYQPNGLTLLSGDVHFAELSRGVSQTKCPGLSMELTDEDVLEVTTSGMTHSCASAYSPYVCNKMLSAYSEHRLRPDDFYIHENFGDINITWHKHKRSGCPVKVGAPVATHQSSVATPSPAKDAAAGPEECEWCPNSPDICRGDIDITLRDALGHPIMSVRKDTCRRHSLGEEKLACMANAIDSVAENGCRWSRGFFEMGFFTALAAALVVAGLKVRARQAWLLNVLEDAGSASVIKGRRRPRRRGIKLALFDHATEIAIRDDRMPSQGM